MLPLSLLRGAINHPVLVELKNGETYNGQLMNVDNWMNLNLKDVICTSKDGEKFWKMGECYIRGSSIKYMRVPDEVAEIVKADMARNKSRPDKRPGSYNNNRGGGGGRGGLFRGRGGGPGGPGRGGGKSFRGGGYGSGGDRGGHGDFNGQASRE
ncbi:hypothetical protein RvY_19368 [Ramazzottius varieornatus]|uniref:U6 snRNA-associated Sm-like protein LSm4 n=1 Tax=Ramazzottius varieornatus TaxID=947166 RepID=A0A1D1W978_RAMVA|nr:hypothetical protein RvY_19368 [Ramazzottius varieornatus]